MAEGYFTRKWMSLRWPTYLTLKGVWDIRQMTRKEEDVALIFHEKLIELVEREHRVTKALGLQKKAVEEARTVEKDSHKVSEYISFEKDNLLHIYRALEEEILDAEGKRIREDLPPMVRARVLRIFVKASKAMQAAAAKIRMEESEEYKDVIRLINQAVQAQGRDRVTVMEAVKTYLRKQPGILNRLLMRKECRTVRNNLNRLKMDKLEIEGDLNKIGKLMGKAEKDWDAIIGHLEKYLLESTYNLEQAFLNAYYALKRDFLMLYLLLVYIIEGGQEAEKWIREHLMPEAPEREFKQGLEDILKNIDKHMHEIAQAIRVITHEDETVIKLARDIEGQARNNLARAA